MDEEEYRPQYTMAPHDAAMIRQALTLTADVEPHDFPQDVQDRYWSFKRVCDRMGCRVLPNDLARICEGAGAGTPTPQEAVPSTIIDLWRLGKIAFDTPVVAMWRKKAVQGIFRGVIGDRVVVEIDSQQRNIKAEDVEVGELEACGV
jgi:hypothetical protein